MRMVIATKTEWILGIGHPICVVYMQLQCLRCAECTPAIHLADALPT
eukprot:SAG11_NODE_1467_length_4850_cov_7.452957_5_plen_47_part_00